MPQLRVWAAASAATMCSTLPAFLTGALSVQIRDDLDYSITLIGLFIGTAFAVAGLASASMGRIAQMLGAGRALRIGLTGTAVSMVLIAGAATRAWHFFVLVGFSGFVNALNQPAANLLLAKRVPEGRLGLALAVKQSGMPGSALLGGAAVPAIALTAGWRWAYVAAAGLTVVAIGLQPIGAADTVRLAKARANDARPEMPTRLLALYATVGLLGATTAGAMVTLLTSGATNAGMGEGVAGWLLSLGSAAGIASRLYQGWSVDTRGILPIQRLIWLLGIGAAGLLLMSLTSPITYAFAVVPAFAAGWAWPGLFNLSVIRNNPSAPAAATGITQTGIFVGAGSGPVIGSLIVDNGGYRPLWIFCAVGLTAGAGVAVYLRTRIKADRQIAALV
ncbi:MAG: MFS transporter [Acidimicrobiales bacterium]